MRAIPVNFHSRFLTLSLFLAYSFPVRVTPPNTVATAAANVTPRYYTTAVFQSLGESTSSEAAVEINASLRHLSLLRITAPV